MKILEVADWPPRLQAMVAPWRGGFAPAVAVRAWEELRSRALNTRPSTIDPRFAEAAAEVESALTHLGRPLTPLSVPAGAVLAARAIDGEQVLVGKRKLIHRNNAVSEALVDHLVVTGGLSYAIQVLARVGRDVMLHEGKLSWLRRDLGSGYDRASLRLRAHVATAEQDTYGAATSAAAEWLPRLPAAATIAIARCFPGEGFAIKAAQEPRLIADTQAFMRDHARVVLATIHVDAVLVAPLIRDYTYGAALTLLAQCGPPMVELLLAVPRHNPDRARALALCEQERAFEAVLEMATENAEALPEIELACEIWPALAERVLSGITEGAHAVLAAQLQRKLRGSAEASPASADSFDGVPELLQRPPWLTGKSNAKPSASITGLTLPVFVAEPAEPTSTDPEDTALVGDGDVEHILNINNYPLELMELAARGDASLHERVREAFTREHGTFKLWVLRRFPRALASALEASLPPAAFIVEPDEVELLLALRGLAALDFLIPLCEGHADAVLGGAVRCSSPRLGPVAAAALHKTKARGAALAWLDRHPRAAAIGLLQDALGPRSRGRMAAVEALSWLAQRGHMPELLAVASETVPDVTAGLEALLTRDPLLDVPTKRPTLPAFATPEALPPLRLTSGRILPRMANIHLLEMLRISPPEAPYEGVLRVRDAFDPLSLGGFSWELFELWRTHGMQANNAWALHQLAWLGGDREAEALWGYLQAWPNPSNSIAAITISKATDNGVDVLSRMSCRPALALLFWLEKDGPPRAQRRAFERLTELADEAGVSFEALRKRARASVAQGRDS